MFTVNFPTFAMVYLQCNKVTQSIDHNHYGFGLQCTTLPSLTTTPTGGGRSGTWSTSRTTRTVSSRTTSTTTCCSSEGPSYTAQGEVGSCQWPMEGTTGQVKSKPKGEEEKTRGCPKEGQGGARHILAEEQGETQGGLWGGVNVRLCSDFVLIFVCYSMLNLIFRCF